jgi:hypothetical protein
MGIYTEAGYDRLMKRAKTLISHGTITVADILAWAEYEPGNKKQNFTKMTDPRFTLKEKRWNNLVKNTRGTANFEVLFGMSSALAPDTAGGSGERFEPAPGLGGVTAGAGRPEDMRHPS